MIERRWAFVLTIIGIFVLILIVVYSKETRVDSQEDIDELEVNRKIIVSGEIESERKFGNGIMMSLDVSENEGEGEGEEIEVLCDNCRYGNVGKRVGIIGVIIDVYGEKKVEALRVVFE